MTHQYTISGMTCSGCRQKVQALLSQVPGVTDADIDLASGKATLTMVRHVPTQDLRRALAAHPKYQIAEQQPVAPIAVESDEEQKSWWQQYKPIVLIFAFITGVTVLAEVQGGGFNGMRWMNRFMTAFFLVFSFFKLLDVKGFAESYAGYDIVAARWRGWGYLYPFVELALGIAYLTNIAPLLTNTITAIVMTISIVGVLQSVLNKRKIRCACLGAVFNLPMSTVTIIEDASMIAMSVIMLFTII